MDIHTLLDRLAAAKIPYNSVADAWEVAGAMAKDRPIWIAGEQVWHYSFDKMPLDSFTDIMLEEIADSLSKSTKATGITLFHGMVTDKGMKLFLKALRETKAPISELSLDDLAVTDESLKELPAIIKFKGIKKCDLGILGISDALRREIDKAVADVRKNVFEKAGKNLKPESPNIILNTGIERE